MKEFAAKKSQKLSKCIADELGYLPYYYVKKLIANKDVKVNGARTSADMRREAGSAVCVYFDENKFMPYTIVYEDENIIAADKSAGISSEKLYELLKEKYNTLKFVHRLDTNTSGLIIFAANEGAESELLSAFRERRTDKRYICRVYGVFREKQGILSAYLTKNTDKGVVSVSDKKSAGAEAIKTGFTVIAEPGDGTSVLQIRLYTGKTHQIRAHMKYIGHFVIGDGKYGDERINRLYGESRQNLRSAEITFDFPESSLLSYLSGRKFSVKAPFDFKNFGKV